jgi:hypothetical protein
MPPLAAFPLEAPFRVDQVRQAPGLMTGLFLVQLLLASALAWSGRRRWRRAWLAAAVALLLVTAVFFTLASWGNSDIAKLNHHLGRDPRAFLAGEPLWWALAPLIVQLPYRMAAVQGLTAAAFAGVGLVLARAWARPAWGGWWALLITTSPLLRGFLQNAHTRQALATLLALPLMLWMARLLRPPRPAALAAAAFSLLVHMSAPVNLLLAVAPRPLLPRRPTPPGRPSERRPMSLPLLLGSALLAALLLIPLWPPLLLKLQAYLFRASFFSTYPLRYEVLELQRTLAVGFVGTCLRRRLGWRELWDCRHSRVLALFATLYGGIQLSVHHEWLPQIGFRLGDAVGLFLLVSLLAWFRAHESLWMLLPALVFCLGDWGVNRLWDPEPKLRCGEDDDFLCIPDRWPGAVTY